MPPLTPESSLLQTAAIPLAVAAWAGLAGLRHVNPQASGPAWWAAALGAMALTLALLPSTVDASPLGASLHAMLALAAMLAALEGTLRFRGRPVQPRRWQLGTVALVLAGGLAWLGAGGWVWPGRALDAAHAAVALALAVVGARGASGADRVGLRLAAAFALLLGVAYACRAWAGGGAVLGAPTWWLLALMIFCAGWPVSLLLACYGRAHTRVRALATQDLLTSLSNGRHFETRLASFAAEAGRGGPQFGLAVLSLDGLAEVNRLLGSDAGDAMLAEFARRLRRAVRHDDLVARTGGQEFAAVLFGATDSEALQATLDRLVTSLQGPLAWQGHALRLHCRIGAATWGEAQGRLDDLRALTDRRLSAAQPVPDAGPWVSPAPTPPRPPGTRSRASDPG